MRIPKKAQKLFKLAKKEIEDRKYDAARLILNNTLKTYPYYAEAMSLLGYVHYKLKFKLLSKEDVFDLSNKSLSLNDQSPIVWLHMGNAYSFLKRFDEAIDCYNKAKDLGLEDAELWNDLGIAYLKLMNIEKAFLYFKKAINVNPNLSPALNNIGYCYLLKKEYQKAIQFLDKAIKIDPGYSAPWSNKGNLYVEKKDYAKALKCYIRGYKIDPEDARLLNNLGAFYLSQKKYENALKFCKKAVSIDPSSGNPWVNIGAIHTELFNYKIAFESYDKAIELDPTLYKAWYNKGNIFIKIFDFSNAISSYKKSLDLNPSFQWAWTNLANAYLQIRDFSKAKKYYKKAIELELNPKIEWFNLGNVYRYKGKFVKAIKSYQKALDLDEDYGAAWFNQGISYLLNNDYDMAINCLNEAIEIDSENLGAWGNLGIAYESNKEFDNAIACYQFVLKLDPNDILALNNIGHVYSNKGNFKDAIRFFKKALKVNPNYVVALDNLGYAYLYNNNYDKAAEFYLIATEIFPYTPKIWINLGVAYNKLGNYQEALNCVKKAIELKPNDLIGHMNLGVLLLNNFKYSEALKEFDIAITIIQEKGFSDYLDQFTELKNLTISALKLKPDLNIIDEKIQELKNYNQIIPLTKKISEIYYEFASFFNKVNQNNLPTNTRSLLNAKFHLFEYLFKILFFYEVKTENLKEIQELFGSNTNFINFFFAVQNLNDLIQILKSYNDLEEISSEIQEKIVIAIQSFESLDGELTEVITGSIKRKQIIIKPSPATKQYEINEVKIKNFKNDTIKISIVQIDYEVSPTLPFILQNRENIRDKIIKALEIAEKNQIDIICFPELCLDDELLEEVKKFDDIIIIAGTYYNKDNYNMCPVIIYGAVYPVFKMNPSYFENEIVKGFGMKCGSEVTIFQTVDNKFRFVVLICLDFIQEWRNFVDGENKVNFIFVPSYNPSKRRFQRNADILCETHQVDIGISNLTEKEEKFGGSCFICFENRSFFDYLVKSGIKKSDEILYKVIEAKKESMLIINLEPKEIKISKTPETIPKILRIEIKKYDGKNWVDLF